MASQNADYFSVELDGKKCTTNRGQRLTHVLTRLNSAGGGDGIMTVVHCDPDFKLSVPALQWQR